MAKKILITGGTGTLGSHLVRLAINNGRWDSVHATYCTVNPNYHKVFWHFMDARNLIRSMLEKIQPDCIIHTLAMSSPDECEKKKLDSWQINVETVKEIMHYCQTYPARLIFTSTDLVFDGQKGNYTETDTPNPVNFYGDTKYEAEQEILNSDPPVRHAVVRMSLLYGMNLNLQPNFFKRTLQAIHQQKPIDLFQDQYRTMMSVSNAADCLLELAESDFTGIMHLAGPERIHRYEFGLRLAKYLNLSSESLIPVQTSEVKLVARRPLDVSLNNQTARNILQTPLMNMDEGLKSIFADKSYTELID
jgi:dTDP-4-dehydrorhamnose reductase